MFVPGDPRFDEMLLLADWASGKGLLDHMRPRWRELVTLMLGSISEEFSQRRQHLRAATELRVELVAPDEVKSLVTSTIGSGGLSFKLPEPLPLGTPVELAIRLEGRPSPLPARAQVVWNHNGYVGVAFIDLFQNDREVLEGLAVKALLAQAAAG